MSNNGNRSFLDEIESADPTGGLVTTTIGMGAIAAVIVAICFAALLVLGTPRMIYRMSKNPKLTWTEAHPLFEQRKPGDRDWESDYWDAVRDSKTSRFER